MSRIRSIHPGIYTDEAWASVSIAARWLAGGLMTQSDDAGVFEWKPLQIKMRIFPADAVDVAGMLCELVEAGIVRRYEAGSKPYGAVRNFCKYQRPRKPKMVHPLPAEIRAFVAIDSAPAADAMDEGEPVQQKSEPVLQRSEMSPQMEDEGGKREEEQPLPETNHSTPNVRSIGKPMRPARDELQEKFWKAYPSRGEAANPKAPALEKFARAVKGGADPEEIIAAAARYAEVERRAGRAGTDKVAQAVTWLNQRRWGDYPAAAPASEGQSSLVFVAIGTEAFDAWNDHKGKKHPFKYYPDHGADGWLFPSEFPPGYEAYAERERNAA